MEKHEKLAPDATGKLCSEGYYAVAPGVRGVVLIPPGVEMAAGVRLATDAEVLAGPEQPAWVEHLAGGTVDHELAAEKFAAGAKLAAEGAAKLGR